MIVQSCQICGGVCSDIDGDKLADGTLYHARCYYATVGKLKALDEQIVDLHGHAAATRNRIEKNQMFREKLYRFFSGKHSYVEDMNTELIRTQVAITHLSQEKIWPSRQLQKLYDVWPTYPPDWADRRMQVLSATRVCRKCRKWNASLHVHHKKPMSRGGSHRPENLRALCETCHSEAHDGKTIWRRTKAVDVDRSPYGGNRALLEEAIGHSLAVHFSYRKFNGTRSTRTISPTSLRTVDNALCVVGYCHLRKAERIFAVTRMRGVKLVPKLRG